MTSIIKSVCPADIDECSSGTHLCSYNCTNTIGAYTCNCDIGYKLNANGLQCDGECLLSPSCHS